MVVWRSPTGDGHAIELGFERLAEDSALRAELAVIACTRSLRTWRDYAEDVAAALEAEPPVRHLVTIHGSRVAAPLDWLHRSGVSTQRLQWREDTATLLPTTVDQCEGGDRGGVQLHGMWAILPYESCEGEREALEIVACAQALGLRVALTCAEPCSPGMLSEVNLALFPDDETRDTALAIALRDLPKTVGVRSKCRVSSAAETLGALAAHEPPIAPAGALKHPERVFYWVDDTPARTFGTGIERVVRSLGRALQQRGVDLIPICWDAHGRRIALVSDEGPHDLAAWSGPRLAHSTPTLPEDLDGEWLLLPEIAMSLEPHRPEAASIAQNLGMRCAAIFDDLIPEEMPNADGVRLDARRRHCRNLASVDVVLAASWTGASNLQRILRDAGLRLPRIVPCPLAGDAGEILDVDGHGEEGIADRLVGLADEPSLRLGQKAAARPVRSWNEYADDVSACARVGRSSAGLAAPGRCRASIESPAASLVRHYDVQPCGMASP